MKIAFTTLACPEWTMDQIIARAVEYGYDGVDFRGYAGEMNIYKLTEFSASAAVTADKFADAGLAISAFSSSARIFEPQADLRAAHIEEVVQYRRLCEIFSTRHIRVFGGSIGRTPRKEAIAVAAEALEKMAEAAAPVCIAVETHDDFVDSSLLAGVMEKVRAGNIGVLWDLHNPFRINAETPQQTYDNIGRYTCCTHVKDSRRGPDGKWQYTLPGRGDVPLEEMINLLKAGGYDGYLTVEWEKRWHPELAEPEVALPAYAAFLRKFL